MNRNNNNRRILYFACCNIDHWNEMTVCQPYWICIHIIDRQEKMHSEKQNLFASQWLISNGCVDFLVVDFGEYVAKMHRFGGWSNRGVRWTGASNVARQIKYDIVRSGEFKYRVRWPMNVRIRCLLQEIIMNDPLLCLLSKLFPFPIFTFQLVQAFQLHIKTENRNGMKSRAMKRSMCENSKFHVFGWLNR